MNTIHLTSEELAARWDVKESTVGQWRWFGKGPSYLKLGTLVLYRIKDIEKFEDLAVQHLKEGRNNEVFSRIRIENKGEK